MSDSLSNHISIGFMKHFRVHEHTLFQGSGSLQELGKELIRRGHRHPFICSGNTVLRLGKTDELFSLFEQAGLDYTVFSHIPPDPGIGKVEEGFSLYQKNRCDCVLAIGGGSVLDCAKLIALRAGNPSVGIPAMTLYLCPLHSGAPVYAAPTTAGTGSEVTLFAVVTDEARQKKSPVVSDRFLPVAVCLDPELSASLPEKTTVASGIDAFSHGLEAYISRMAQAFPEDRAYAAPGCKKIWETLPRVIKEPENRELRLRMAQGAYETGLSFRRISTGYIHAIAHRLGETFQLPHGAAIAIAMPWVLEQYLPEIEETLCAFGRETGILAQSQNAGDLIAAIRGFLLSLGLPESISPTAEQRCDIRKMVRRIQREAALQGIPEKIPDEVLTAFLQRVIV